MIRRAFEGFVRFFAGTVGALVLIVVLLALGVFLDPLLRPEIARERARAPELTLRVGAGGAEDFSHFWTNPFDAGAEFGMWVDYEDIARHPMLIEAILEREDRHFFHWWHFGVNVVSYAEVLWTGLRSNYWRGGSGIEQQTAKHLFAGSARDFSRKFRELMQAFWLASRFSKEEILAMYLNVAFFGNGTRGIEAAARYYFGYSFKREQRQEVEFTPLMAASLAITLSSPTGMNPSKPGNIRQALALLKRMHERGTLSDEEWAEAQANPTLPLTLGESGQMMPVSASQIRDPAIRELAALDLNLPGGDRILRVPLYFEAVSQLYVERAISHHPQLAQAGYTVSVYVVNNETGGVEAVYNPQASFYPASTLKPFITLCLLRQGMDRWSLVADEPVGSPPLRNSYNGYFGSMPLGVALARSTNTVFLSALDRFGQGCTAESIAAAGGTLTLPEAENRTIALGSAPVDVMQFLQSYVAIASCGETGTVRYLREVREGGRTLHRVRTEPADMAQDMQDEINELLAMMEGAAQPGGTAAGIIVDRPVAAKTGTAQGNRQISFLSLTGNYTVLVTAFADPANIRTPLPSTALMPLAREINANIHLAHPVGERELGCRVENEPEAER